MPHPENDEDGIDALVTRLSEEQRREFTARDDSDVAVVSNEDALGEFDASPQAPTLVFDKWERRAIQELARWVPGADMAGVSISEGDRANGSPKEGDYIARNPKNHADKWLIAFAYLKENGFFWIGPIDELPQD